MCIYHMFSYENKNFSSFYKMVKIPALNSTVAELWGKK